MVDDVAVTNSGAPPAPKGWERRLDDRLAAAAGALRRGPLGRWAGPNLTALTVLAAGLVIVLAMLWLAEEVYDAVTAGNGVAGLDRPALDLALRLRNPGLDRAVTMFTNLGGTVGMTLIALVAAGLLCRWYRSWVPLGLLAVAAAGSLAMTMVGKQVIGRVRPPTVDAVPPFESSPSFPSGHTLNSTVIVGLIGYLVCLRLARRRARTAVGLAATLFVVGIGLSRVYLGHHWLTDVLVGWVLGLGWLAVVLTAHRLWSWRRQLPPPEPTGPTTT